MKDTLDRREFLKINASAAAALCGAPLDLRTGSPKPMERKGAAKSVIVVGAGLAGLSAAYDPSNIRLKPTGTTGSVLAAAGRERSSGAARDRWL